jgi:hypothetical protein
VGVTGDPVTHIHGGSAAAKVPHVVITDARSGASAEQRDRQRRYAITMAFRTACFVCMVFVEGPARWVLFACAVFLPYVAVVLANQEHTRTDAPRTVAQGEPTAAPQIGDGSEDVIPGSVVRDERGGSHPVDEESGRA